MYVYHYVNIYLYPLLECKCSVIGLKQSISLNGTFVLKQQKRNSTESTEPNITGVKSMRIHLDVITMRKNPSFFLIPY